MKAVSHGISGGKQVMKLTGNTSNRGRVCLFFQNETTMLFMQNLQFEFLEVLRLFSLALRTSRVAAASKKDNFTHNLQLFFHCIE